MAAPARRTADGPDPDDDPDRKPDPRASAWADVREMVVTDSLAIRRAVEDVKRAAQDVKRAAQELREGRRQRLRRELDAAVARLDAAVEMSGLTVRIMESASTIASRCAVGEALLEAHGNRRYAEGYDQGAADCKAARCRMEVIDGGRAR